jgi:hypothetical protein
VKLLLARWVPVVDRVSIEIRVKVDSVAEPSERDPRSQTCRASDRSSVRGCNRFIDSGLSVEFADRVSARIDD